MTKQLSLRHTASLIEMSASEACIVLLKPTQEAINLQLFGCDSQLFVNGVLFRRDLLFSEELTGNHSVDKRGIFAFGTCRDNAAPPTLMFLF